VWQWYQRTVVERIGAEHPGEAFALPRSSGLGLISGMGPRVCFCGRGIVSSLCYQCRDARSMIPPASAFRLLRAVSVDWARPGFSGGCAQRHHLGRDHRPSQNFAQSSISRAGAPIDHRADRPARPRHRPCELGQLTRVVRHLPAPVAKRRAKAVNCRAIAADTTTASRVRGRIESVLHYAKAQGWFQGENPAAGADISTICCRLNPKCIVSSITRRRTLTTAPVSTPIPSPN
jgi:hypothetical protein